MKTLAMVNGNDFRTMVKAALSVSVKKAAFSMCESILIKACDNVLYICGNTLNQVYRGQCKCDCDGIFEVTINENTAKKIVNIKGNNITITYDSDEDKKIKIADGKKTMELACFTPSDNDFNYDSYTCELEKDRSIVFTVDAEELLDGIKTVAPFRSFNEAKPVLQGFNFNGETGHLETIDGYRAIRKSWKTLDKKSDYNFTVDEHLDNIGNIFNKNDRIAVSIDEKGKYTVFSKTDGNISIEYGARNLEGTFHPIAKAIPTNFTTDITLVSGELLEVVKEYSGYTSAKNPAPMIFAVHNGEFYTYMSESDTRVCDKVAAKINGNPDVFAGYKAKYLLDSFKVFDKKENISIKYIGTLQPILMTNGEYEVLNLPVRLKDDARENFLNVVA